MAETPSDAGLDPGRGRAVATSAGREASDWGEAFNGDRLREECGVFGIFGHPDAAAITALGLHERRSVVDCRSMPVGGGRCKSECDPEKASAPRAGRARRPRPTAVLACSESCNIAR